VVFPDPAGPLTMMSVGSGGTWPLYVRVRTGGNRLGVGRGGVGKN